MKIKRFYEFRTNESDDFSENPEEYVNDKLHDLKLKIDKYFNPDQKEESDDLSNFKRIGLKLDNSEISKYSKLYDSLQIKFSDDTNFYSLYIMIQLENALKDKEATDDISECYIKFKKYDNQSTELIGKLSKNVKIKDINKDFIISLKSELDKKIGDNGEDDLQIEYK